MGVLESCSERRLFRYLIGTGVICSSAEIWSIFHGGFNPKCASRHLLVEKYGTNFEVVLEPVTRPQVLY